MNLTTKKNLEYVCSQINKMQMVLEDDIYEKSTIANHFKGKCVFLTGGAGFLGQVFIEKLLRYFARQNSSESDDV